VKVLTQRLRETEEDLKLANSMVEGVSSEMGRRQNFGDAVAAQQFDHLLDQTRAEYTAKIHSLEAHARQLEAALGERTVPSEADNGSTTPPEGEQQDRTDAPGTSTSGDGKAVATGTQTTPSRQSIGLQTEAQPVKESSEAIKQRVAQKMTLESASTALAAA